MTTKLPLIRFNVKERGRTFLGQNRDFDITKLCKVINGGACQEKIRTRAMLGYFGHGLRKLVGMDIPESAVISGKYTEIEPAVVTTFLKAYENGDIEHQSEFLDTESGQRAAKMFNSKVGGFSSAIKADNYEFCGFDWVSDPNYVSNRPYILDSTDGLILDDVRLEIAQENAWFFEQLANKKDSDLLELKHLLDSLTETVEFVTNDRDNIAALLDKRNAILDSASNKGFMLPMLARNDRANQIKQGTQSFLDATNNLVLEQIEIPESEDVERTIKETAKSLKRNWN